MTVDRSPFHGRQLRIAQVLAAHARDGGDVGDLLAAACRTAAVSLDGVRLPGYDAPLSGGEALLAGRPGSWEAEHLRGLAGGWEYEREGRDR